jgi:hypothetical protein
MLVTSDGVQMPSKSRDIAAVPELMGLKATVVSINNTTILTYVVDVLIITWQMLE